MMAVLSQSFDMEHPRVRVYVPSERISPLRNRNVTATPMSGSWCQSFWGGAPAWFFH